MSTPIKDAVCQGCYVYWFKLSMWHTGSLPAEKTTVARIQAAAAADDCPCCRIVADGLAAISPAWLAKVKSNPISILWRTDIIVVQLRGDNSSNGLTICGHVDGPTFNHGVRFAARSEVMPDTRSEAAFRTANAWLTKCVNNHAACAQPFFSSTPTTTQADVFVPTRVLDVDSGGNDRIILVENAPSGSPYVALSYCWGPDPSGTVTTRMDNLPIHMDLQRGIKLATLPQTIQDAVLVCRRLHVRYLWIDALCIVQDDGDDWRREAAQMCNVYQRSHVTIAAHRASACQHGFLGEQDFGQEDYQCVFWTDGGIDDKTGQKQPRKKMLLRDQHKKIHSLPTAPLGSRAWTLQEVVLPRRLLHFFDYEMAWECQTTHHCECGDTTGFDAPHLPMLGLALRALDKEDVGSSNSRGRIAKLNWMSLVEQYSRRSLTRLSDKLIAMDGLARMVEAATAPGQGGAPSSRLPPLSLDNTVIRPAYVEGLFVADFARQLLWGVSHNNLTLSSAKSSAPPKPTARRLSSQLHAPSWSWASIDASVGYSMIYAEQAESLIRVDGFAPCTFVREGVKTPLPAGGPVRRRPPLVARSTIVRASNGFAYGVFCDDVQAPDLFFDSPELPCWVADDSSHHKGVREEWLSKHSNASDTDTDNALTRSCQHNRGRHIRAVYQNEEDDNAVAKSRWCSTCRVWPSDDVAWQNIDAGITGNVAARTSTVSGLSLLMQVFRYRGAGSYTVCFLALRPSIKVPGAWERFGHGRYVTWDKDAPHVDLFWGSKTRDLLLV